MPYSELLSTSSEFAPASAGELARFIADNNAGPRHPLYPIGGRTSINFAAPQRPGGQLVATAQWNQTVDYPARDMTITVGAGVKIEQLAALLKAEGQRLPVDISLAHRATLGGAIAANTSGPRRFGHGTLRDYVIGIKAVDGHGRVFQSGGRVVKNVAGYDLCKLLVGSCGTLAVIAQVTLKLKPIPETTSLLWAVFDSFPAIDGALERLLTSNARPVAIEAANAKAARQLATEAKLSLPVEGPVLIIGLEGTGREVRWQAETLKRELDAHSPRQIELVNDPHASRLWSALTEFPISSDDPLTFQASLLPSKTTGFIEKASALDISLQAHAANGIVIGHLSDATIAAEQARAILNPLRSLAADARGRLTVINCEKELSGQLPLFGPPHPSQPLMQRLKAAFDPHNVLNPGRMFGPA